MQLFHGTRDRFNDFITPAWFTANAGMARIYSFNDREFADSHSRVIIAEVLLKNPLDLRAFSLDDWLSAEEFNSKAGIAHKWAPCLKPRMAHEWANDPACIASVMAAGYDGYLAKETHPADLDRQEETVSAFSSDQVSILSSCKKEKWNDCLP
jgi:hypothetical protein